MLACANCVSAGTGYFWASILYIFYEISAKAIPRYLVKFEKKYYELETTKNDCACYDTDNLEWFFMLWRLSFFYY